MDEGQGSIVRKKLSQRKNILKIEKRESSIQVIKLLKWKNSLREN